MRPEPSRDSTEEPTKPVVLEQNVKVRLTEGRVQKYRASGAIRLVWDEEVRGFGIRVSPSGLKTFFLKGRVGPNGKQVWLTVGQYPEIGLAEAREEAFRWRSVLRKGGHPKSYSSAAGNVPTVQEFSVRYLEEYSAVFKKPRSQEKDQDLLNRVVNPAIGHLRLDEVTRAHVMEIRARLSDRKQAANHTMSAISGLFTQAREMGIYNGGNPAKGIRKFPMKPRDRHLSDEELERLGAELKRRDETHPVASDFFRLLLLTGCRRGEMLSLSWEEVDLHGGVLRLKDSKTGAKLVPLSDGAVECLKRLEERKAGRWVFAGPDPKHHIKTYRNVWASICKVAKLENLTIHDLRRSHATFAGLIGVDESMIQSQLGHKDGRQLSVYLKRSVDAQRAAVNMTGDYIGKSIS